MTAFLTSDCCFKEEIGKYEIFLCLDNPDSPQSVKIDDYDRDSVVLTWKPPDSDGGNPIKGYVVEKRTPKGQWARATAGVIPDTTATLTGLEPGREYEFRVAAVNDGGPGDFSRPTMPHLMRDKIGRSYFYCII